MSVGKQGDLFFGAGSYLYVGSSYGKTSTSLGYRLMRHESPIKSVKWHINYLLEVAEVLAFHFVISAEPLECQIAILLGRKSPKLFDGFGASDCHNHCMTHLFQADIKIISSVINELGFKMLTEGKTANGTQLIQWD
ncbi:MAG: DUF123 domain-containing protein [Candidatus Hodarchaeota archaeon]